MDSKDREGPQRMENKDRCGQQKQRRTTKTEKDNKDIDGQTKTGTNNKESKE
jgi:hypothetical protein